MQNPTIVDIPPIEESAQHPLVPNNPSITPTEATSSGLLATTTDESSDRQIAPKPPVQLPNYKVAAASSAWQYDDLSPRCNTCNEDFNALNRRHHCRYCGTLWWTEMGRTTHCFIRQEKYFAIAAVTNVP